MDTDTWKIENNICRCCHAEGYFFNLAEPRPFCGQTEVYADMIRDIFDIDMRPLPGPLNSLTYTICMSCIFKLREAIQFKKQVQSCEDKFLDYYYTNKLEVKKKEAAQAVIKLEPVVEFKEEYLEDDDFDSNDDTNLDFEVLDDDDEDEDAGSKSDTTLEIQTKKGKGKGKGKSDPVQKVAKKEPPTVKEEEETTKKLVKVSRSQVQVPVKKKDERNPFSLRKEDYEKLGNKLKCKKCDREFEKMASLSRHVKYQHNKLYTCKICREGFSTETQITVHKYEKHNIDDRYECNACHKRFNSHRLLLQHMNYFHMLGTKFKCKSCDYETYNGASLTKHQFRHKTVKEHHCKFCEKSFLRKNTLNFHERIHTGDKRKVCNECGKAFVQKASLNYHMTKYHPAVRF